MPEPVPGSAALVSPGIVHTFPAVAGLPNRFRKPKSLASSSAGKNFMSARTCNGHLETDTRSTGLCGNHRKIGNKNFTAAIDYQGCGVGALPFFEALAPVGFSPKHSRLGVPILHRSRALRKHTSSSRMETLGG